jgi:hypothetical protein
MKEGETMNHTQLATKQIADAILLLKQAKRSLLQARSDQHIHVAVQLASLEDIHGILTDPECTPAISEGR